MTNTDATAKVFWTAFQVLPHSEKQAVIRRMMRSKSLRRDMIDLAIIENRKAESVRPLRKYLEESR
ncbi:MAG: hypothetical protein HYU36_10750 [Planctomycetes bacterium]|nr:hypothetical protein [Planctomycetota bacterium]